MNAMKRFVLTVGVAALAVVPALGQERQPQPPIKIQPVQPTPVGLGNPLVNDKGVREHLRVTDEQAAKFKALQDKQQEAIKELQTAKDRQKYQETVQAIRQDMDKVLNPEQTKRLKQLELQARGAAAVLDPQVSKDINLTPEQRQQVTKIIQGQTPKLIEINKELRGNLEEYNKKVAELRKSGLEEAVKALTPEQQRKVQDIIGEPYKGVLPAGLPGIGIRPIDRLPPVQIQPVRPIQIQPVPPVKIEIKPVDR